MMTFSAPVPQREDTACPAFQAVWNRIAACAGSSFRTKTGLPFTYVLQENALIPDRTGYALSKSDFLKAWLRMPLNGPGEINRLVRGPSYIYAILTDPRIG